MENPTRLPHAALDGPSRLPKAEKIARLLALQLPADRPLRILEVGAGSGLIAQYFGRLVGARGEVDAVDVVDQRTAMSDYRFHLVESTTLPFADGVFDAVISNHVIEHVGVAADQQAHLRELARVLRDDGKGYLAVPSRWQLVEPHYHLAFLGWLPHGMRSPYLRLRRRGDFYDCEPLTMCQLEACFDLCGLARKNLFVPAVRALADTERKPAMTARLAAALPERLLCALRPFSPTHIYLFGKQRSALNE